MLQQRTISRPASFSGVGLHSGSRVTLTFLPAASFADNWPHWRGPENDGISKETNLPTTWDAKTNMVWTLPMPGPGCSTPVVWGDRIFLTSEEGKDVVGLCVSTAGKILWKTPKLGSSQRKGPAGEGIGATASPNTDGKHVWFFVDSGILEYVTVYSKEANTAPDGSQRVNVSNPTTSATQLRAMLQTNLTGVFLFSQAVGRLMIRQRTGKIINVTSVAGRSGSRGLAAYAASKKAIFTHQRANDTVVLNYDDPFTCGFAAEAPGREHSRLISPRCSSSEVKYV